MSSDLDDAVARLDDYMRGAAVEASYEEDLFERALAGTAPELAFRASIEATLREMSTRGTLDLWRTARQVEELMAGGHRVRRFDVDPARLIAPDLSGDFDILVTKVPLSLEGVRRLDAEVLAPDGSVLKRMPDIEFDIPDGAIYACCEADLARAAASARTLTRLWATDDSGASRLVAEFLWAEETV